MPANLKKTIKEKRDELGQVSLKKKFLARISIKKEAGGRFSFVVYYFLLYAFFTHYYLPPGIRWTLRTMSLVF